MITHETVADADTARLIRWNSLSQRQRDTEVLMRDLRALAEAKAGGNSRLIRQAYDEIEGAALYCETPAVRQRYEAVLAARMRSSAGGGRVSSTQEELAMTTGDTDAGEWITFNLDDFGGDMQGLQDAVGEHLKQADQTGH